MFGCRGLLIVMVATSYAIAFLRIPIPKHILAFPSHRSKKRGFFNTVDLCSDVSYSQIIPGLYLTNARAACDRSVLRDLKITHLLTIEANRLPKSTLQGSHISSLFIRAYDLPSTDLLPYFPMANKFIDEGLQKGNVIVHCHFGVSRSATLVIAYIMQRYNMSYDEGLAFVRQRRKFVNPNAGFAEQLREYHRMNYDVGAMKRLEAFFNVTARRHKYKIASALAVILGILVPVAVIVA